MTTSKKNSLTIAALALLIGLGGLTSTASAMPEHKERGHRFAKNNDCLPQKLKEQLPAYDSNKNGKLERVERRALRANMRAAAHAEFDQNKDGKLDKQERKELRRSKMVEHFEALDKNANAEISQAEAKDSCTPVERRFDKIDLDGNGAISWVEFEQGAAKKMRKRQQRRAKHMRRNRNGSGNGNRNGNR